jgi:arylsulfatase A-like enzyme
MKSLTLAIAVTALLFAACTNEKELTYPNIVVFLVDDMGVMDTSVPFLTDGNGMPKKHPLNEWYRTPNMERLANQGMRFSNFYSHCLCSPSRISILTGKNSSRHRNTRALHPFTKDAGPYTPEEWNWEGLKKGDMTLATVLRNAGYTTIHVGKGHLGPVGYEGAEPLNLGFEVNIAGANVGAPRSYYGETRYGIDAEDFSPHARPVPGLEKYHGTNTFLTEALTLEAKIEREKAKSEEKPFFLYMSHYAVHVPFHSDPRFAANYAGSDKDPATQAYATLIEGMDKSLGDLMDHFAEMGIAENTLILFLGDNGGDAPLGGHDDIASSAPLRGRKGTRWEGGGRVPFIAAWAKPDPERENEFLSHFPHLRWPTQMPENSYWTLYRLDNWKAICRYSEDGNSFELYDLDSDPQESNNLAANNPKKLKAMIEMMTAKLDSCDALYPVDGQGREMRPMN